MNVTTGIGTRIRAARTARGWSTRAAARRLGVSLRFLHELEHGKATARIDKVLRVLAGLGMDLQVVAPRTSSLRGQVQAYRPLLRSIAKAHGARQLSLFGSAARGRERAGSDLDFLADLEKGRSLLDMLGIKQDLELLFGRPVDVFTRKTLKPAVLASARKDLVRVV